MGSHLLSTFASLGEKTGFRYLPKAHHYVHCSQLLAGWEMPAAPKPTELLVDDSWYYRRGSALDDMETEDRTRTMNYDRIKVRCVHAKKHATE